MTFGPASEDATTDMFKRLEQVASTVSCEVTRIHRTSGGGGDKGSVEKPSKVSPRSVSSSPLHTTYAMVRKLPSQGHHLDLRVAVVGNVDAVSLSLSLSHSPRLFPYTSPHICHTSFFSLHISSIFFFLFTGQEHPRRYPHGPNLVSGRRERLGEEPGAEA